MKLAAHPDAAPVPPAEAAKGERATILIYAPTGRDAHLTANFLREFNKTVHVCADMPDLCAKVQDDSDLIILAEETLNTNSVRLFVDRLSRQPEWSDIPISIITSGGEASQERLRILDSIGPRGNVGLLERPFRRGTLLSMVEVALRARKRQYQVRNLIAERENAQVQLEKLVHERTAELTETNDQLETLVYSIAHDLRAPLRSMQAFAHMLLDDFAASMNPEAQDYARRIVRSAETMDVLVLDLLAYGKAARVDVVLESVNVDSAWSTALSQFEQEIVDKKAVVTTRRPLPSVWANATNLSQILANLLGNALKFIEPGTTPWIEFNAREIGPNVRLSLKDNGIGIAPEYHEKIFRVFERLDNSHREGNGIGLAIVRKGVERMGGTVGIISDSSQGGSTFWIELPKAPVIS